MAGGVGDTPYGLAALEKECAIVAGTSEGSRNDTLNRAAFRMARLIGSNNLTTQTAHTALHDAARAAGLQDAEISVVLRDNTTAALNAGQQAPREPDNPLASSTVTEVHPDSITPPTGPDGRPRTSWWPRALTVSAEAAGQEPQPQFLARDDGLCLFYPGKVNGLIGESESGKSWIALLAVHQAISQAQRVLFLDFEDNPATIETRLAAMGTPAPHLAHVDYAHPDEALGVLQAEDLREALDGHGYQLIVADGVNAAMTLLGFDLNSNVDATRFNRQILHPLAGGGAAVLTVDHVPKAAEQRGKGGIGAQSKRAMMDGCALTVEVDKPFGRGQSGALKLWVDKDRPGHVRGISGGGKYAGKAHLQSDQDGNIRLFIEAPGGGDTGPGVWRPTHKMEQVSKLLQDAPEGLSSPAVELEVEGRREIVRQALTCLVDGGWVSRQQRTGRGGGMLYVSLTPYFDGDLTPENKPRPTSPNLAPGEVPETSPRPSLYRRDGRGSGARLSNSTQEAKRGEVTPINRHHTQTPMWTAPGPPTKCERCDDTTSQDTYQQTGGFCTTCAQQLGIIHNNQPGDTP